MNPGANCQSVEVDGAGGGLVTQVADGGDAVAANEDVGCDVVVAAGAVVDGSVAKGGLLNWSWVISLC